MRSDADCPLGITDAMDDDRKLATQTMDKLVGPACRPCTGQPCI